MLPETGLSAVRVRLEATRPAARGPKVYQIVKAVPLNAEVVRMTVLTPEIARKARPGQFIILRIDERGERIPLTISTANKRTGTVSVVFQIVGATTQRLATLKNCLLYTSDAADEL